MLLCGVRAEQEGNEAAEEAAVDEEEEMLGEAGEQKSETGLLVCLSNLFL